MSLPASQVEDPFTPFITMAYMLQNLRSLRNLPNSLLAMLAAGEDPPGGRPGLSDAIVKCNQGRRLRFPPEDE